MNNLSSRQEKGWKEKYRLMKEEYIMSFSHHEQQQSNGVMGLLLLICHIIYVQGSEFGSGERVRKMLTQSIYFSYRC